MRLYERVDLVLELLCSSNGAFTLDTRDDCIRVTIRFSVEGVQFAVNVRGSCARLSE